MMSHHAAYSLSLPQSNPADVTVMLQATLTRLQYLCKIVKINILGHKNTCYDD